MIRNLIAALSVMLAVALPAEAKMLDVTAPEYRAAIAAFAKKGNYVRLKQASNGNWTWTGPNFGTTKGVKLVQSDYEGGMVWAVNYSTGGQPHAVLIDEPSFNDFKSVDAIFLRKDLKELVVYGTQGEIQQPHVINYKYKFSPSALDDLELFIGQN